jgi:hypothetical protein
VQALVQSTSITTKLMAADQAKNKSHTFERTEGLERHAWIHRKTWEYWGAHTAYCRNSDRNVTLWRQVGQSKVRQRCSAAGERQAAFIPRRARDSKLLAFVTGEGTKGLFVESGFAMEEMERTSIIHFVSTNLTNRFEQISVSVRVRKRSDGTSRHRRRIPLPRNGTKGVDPLEL